MRELNELFIEITNNCLQKCVHCSSAASCENNEKIGLVNIKKMVEAALSRGLKNITLSGGEPFLHEEFTSIIEYLTHKLLNVSIYTCGVYLGKDGNLTSIPQELLSYVAKRNVKRLIFSLHAANPQTYSLISGVSGTYDLARKSIESAVRAGMDIELHIVPMKINFFEIEKVLQLAYEEGITKVSLLRFVPQGRGALNTDKLMLDNQENESLRKLIDRWRKLYPKLAIRLGVPYNCLTMKGKKCTAGHNKLLINAKGEIFPCEAFKYLSGARPSIYERDIIDVWDNDELLRQLRTTNVDCVSVCNHCEYRQLCMGGCPGQRMHINGSLFDGPDPLCLRML